MKAVRALAFGVLRPKTILSEVSGGNSLRPRVRRNSLNADFSQTQPRAPKLPKASNVSKTPNPQLTPYELPAISRPLSLF